MVECEAFQEAREPHVQATKYLQDEGAELCDLPVVHQHPYAEYRQTILDAMPEPSIPEQMVQKLQTGRNKDTLQFYTDGSCQYPHLKHLCFASYSIVVDLLEHDVDRRTLAAAFPFTNSLQSFQQIACGLLHGFQSIHRAELIAIVILCENFEEFTVFTDSADVIHKVDICRQTTDSSELAGFTDYDLLLRLHGALKPTKIVLKTKAHREPSQISDLLERYRAMGNATVDCHAKKTCDTLFPEISRELESQCQDVSHDIQELHGVFALILDLQIARARAEEDKRVGQHILDNAGGAQMTKLENRLVNWRIENKWQDQRTWTMRWVQYSAWGSQVMKAVEEWLRSCDWPQEEQNVEEDIGMAWAEVAIALTLFHGQWLPVRRDRQGKQFVLQATSEAELDCWKPIWMSKQRWHTQLFNISGRSCQKRSCRAMWPMARWKLFMLKDIVAGPRVFKSVHLTRDSLKCTTFWLTSCRAAINLLMVCRKLTLTLFWDGRWSYRGGIRNGKTEKNRQKKHSWKSEGNATLFRGTLCV